MKCKTKQVSNSLHGHRITANHRKFHCLFNSLFNHHQRNLQSPALLARCEVKPPVTGGFPSVRAMTYKVFPCHQDVIAFFLRSTYVIWLLPVQVREAEYFGCSVRPGCNGFVSFVCLFSPGWVHYSDDIMGAMASQITSPTIACSTDISRVDQRKHQSSAPLAFLREIHQWPVNSQHKWPVTRKMFPFDDVIMG